MEAIEIISNWRKAQEAGAIMPCPRCGEMSMRENVRQNALSRRADIYICDRCGAKEAFEDIPVSLRGNIEYFKKPIDEWFAVQTVYGEGVAEKTIDGGFVVHSHCRFKVEPIDIDDIMSSALEGGINYWCNKAEVVEEDYLGVYASEQISRGGHLALYDDDECVNILDLERILLGISLLVEKGYDEYGAVSHGKIDTSKVDAVISDRIVQLALFGDIIYG